MFIEPVIMKATKENQEYGVEEPKIENLKTYVISNNFKTGDKNNMDMWRANTRIAKQEIFGAWTQSQNDDTSVIEDEEEEGPGL